MPFEAGPALAWIWQTQIGEVDDMTALFVILYGFLAIFLSYTGYCVVAAINGGAHAASQSLASASTSASNGSTDDEFGFPEPTTAG